MRGERAPRGILFVGEGPSWQDEEQCRPFSGKGGDLLRGALTKLGLHDTGFTNTILCRSCVPSRDEEGNQRFIKRGNRQLPLWKDEPPSLSQMNACLPRLYEEIYLNDPIILVGVGKQASSLLAGRAVNIMSEHGKGFEIEVPGVVERAVLTDKKKAWSRKVGGEVVHPTEAGTVKYFLVPIIHPAAVLRSKDGSVHGELSLFVNDLAHIAGLYKMYHQEVYGDRSMGAVRGKFAEQIIEDERAVDAAGLDYEIEGME